MSVNDSLFLTGNVFGLNIKFLVDTGATLSILHPDKYYDIPERHRPPLEPYKLKLRMGDGALRSTLGCAVIPMVFNGQLLPQKMVIADIDVSGVLGYDFLYENAVSINVRDGSLALNGSKVQCELESELPSVFRVTLSETITIPPNTEVIVRGKVNHDSFNCAQAIVEPTDSRLSEKGILVAKSLVGVHTGELPLRLANMSDDPQKIYSGTLAAKCEPVEIITSDVISHSRENATNQCMDTPPKYGRLVSTSDERGSVPTHLTSLFEASKTNLSESEAEALSSLLVQHAEAFSKYKGDIGRCSLVEHRIHTANNPPIKQAPRRLPILKREAATTEVKRMLDQDLITPSKSPWSSPITLVKKKDGSLRFCIDYRKLNEVTRKDSFPLPRIDDSLDALGGNKYFSVMDLSSGYWQVGVHPDDQGKTAFVTTDGLYNFKVMPYGLCNAGATFERLMELVLAGLHWTTCLLYVDDIICFSKTADEHISRLKEILYRIKEAGLKLSPNKCKLFQREVSFLGHIVSETGVSTEPEKVKAVKEWPIPRNVHELRSFLGTASYYRKFCKSFCDIARPLHKLTEKQNAFVWTVECDSAFKKLKQALTTAPILGYPRSDSEYILDCDCSGYGIGAVLSQKQDGVERVISYYSKSLTKAERNYCVTRRELLAVVNSVKHYHHYLYGTPKFTIRTDHSALRWLLKSFKNPEGQISRWIEALSAYHFEIEHRAGRSHGNCDGLSRIPCDFCPGCRRLEAKENQSSVGPGCSCESSPSALLKDRQGTSRGSKTDPSLSPCGKTQTHEQVNAKSYRRVTTRSQTHSCVQMKQWLDAKSTDDIKNEQGKDRKISVVVGWKTDSDERPSWEQVSHLDVDYKTYWSQWNRLLVKDDILYRRWVSEATGRDHLELVVPETWRAEIIKMLHTDPGAGHMGVKRTVDRLRSRAYWPRLTDAVRSFCQRCEQCQKKKNPARSPKAPMKKYTSGAPNERVQIDIVGPLIETKSSNKYLIVLTDCFTKWASTYAVPRATATAVADAILDWISQFGVMQILHSDQGTQFESAVVTELCQKFGILKTRTTSYYPASDGQVERFNRTLIDMLSKYVAQNQRSWDEHLPLVLLAYRSSVHDSTSLSPAMMTYGREMDLPADLIFGGPESTSKTTNDLPEYVKDLSNNMERVHNLARDKLAKSGEKQKRNYDLKQFKHNYAVGDQVLLYTPVVKKGNCRKLNSRWTGPYIVAEVLSDVVIRIKLNNHQRDKIVHHNRLKPYFE